MHRRFTQAFLLLLITFLLALGITAEDRGPRRIAIVIGNASYRSLDPALADPVANARYVASELKRQGFEVTVAEDLAKDSMELALDQFYKTLTPGSLALVFFSGIALEDRYDNYLLPIDPFIFNWHDIRRNGFGLKSIAGRINARTHQSQILIIDGARRNPYERWYRQQFGGLSLIEPGNDSLVLFSTSPTALLPDVDTANPTFVRALVKAFDLADRPVTRSFNQVREEVSFATNGGQIPFIISSLSGESFLVGHQNP